MAVFACDECRSPAFAIGGKLTDDTPVRCDDCGAPLGSWAEFRNHLERSLANGLQLCEVKREHSSGRKRAAVRLV